jgi:hypothetical protein
LFSSRNGQLDESIVKFYLHTNNNIRNDHQLYVSIDLMRQLMIEDGFSLVKNAQLNNLIKNLTEKVPSPTVIYHFLLIAFIQLEKFDLANSILKKNLNSSFSVEYLDKYLSLVTDQFVLYKEESEMTMSSFQKYINSDFNSFDEATQANVKNMLSLFNSLIKNY